MAGHRLMHNASTNAAVNCTSLGSVIGDALFRSIPIELDLLIVLHNKYSLENVNID